MRYSDIGKDVHGLIGGRAHGWLGEGGRGERQIRQGVRKGGGRSFGLSAGVGESKRNSFGMFSLHGCAGKSTTVREKKYSMFFFIGGPSTG